MEPLKAWWNRPMTVTVSEPCDECDKLKSDVEDRDYWTPTGKVVHHCCSACAKELHRSYYAALPV
jgi:hypothetical protein